MHERSGLERVPVAFARQPMRGQPSQFVIDQWEQFRGGPRIALLHTVEDVGDIAHAVTE